MTALPIPSKTRALPFWRRCGLWVLRVRVSRGTASAALLNGPCIVRCNHVSFLDGVIVVLASPVPLAVATTPRFATHNPITRSCLMFLQNAGLGWVVPVDRHSFMAVRNLLAHLRHGRSVLIFPEGRISRDGLPQDHQRGADWLSRKGGARIVDIRISGAERSRFFAPGGDAVWPRIELFI